MKKGAHMTHKFIKAIKQRSGFTMIELLIVITILGILAVAVLSAINPIEQINRGRDTGTRSDAEQLISAIDRYYAFNGYYPWDYSAAETDVALDFQPVNNVLRVDSDGNPIAGCNMLEVLAVGDTAGALDEATCPASNELKVSFIQRVAASGYNTLWIYNKGNQGDSTYLCFVPKSAAFTQEATDRCDETDGVLPTDYPASACSAEATPTTAPTTQNFSLIPAAFAQDAFPEVDDTIPTENMVCLP